MNIAPHWTTIRGVFREAFRTSLHYAIATVNEDGTPHVTPIGSVLLTERGKGVYFEIFTDRMPRNFAHNRRVCVLAVNSSRWVWFGALFRGAFNVPPAVRLMGTIGDRRPASDREKAMWERRVKFLKRLKGYRLLWGNMEFVRDIEFDSFEPVSMGVTTPPALWSEPEPRTR